MGILHLTRAAALLPACGLIAAPAIPATTPPSAGLTALSESDMALIRETGCTFSFQVGNRTLVMAIGNDLLIGVEGHVHLCTIGDASVSAFLEGRSGTVCADRELVLHKTGRTTSNEASDSASWPGTLTVKQGRSRHSVRGIAGTAC